MNLFLQPKTFLMDHHIVLRMASTNDTAVTERKAPSTCKESQFPPSVKPSGSRVSAYTDPRDVGITLEVPECGISEEDCGGVVRGKDNTAVGRDA